MDKPKSDAVFNYSVAGLKVTTNRQASDLDERGYCDISANIIFRKAQSAKPSGGRHELIGSSGSLRAFIREDGKEILIYEENETPDYAMEIRRTVPFASALQRRIILHASAIEYFENVHAFIGGSGAGKSTLANRLSRLGLPILSDDLLPCRINMDIVSVPTAERGSKRFLPLTKLFFLFRNASLENIKLIEISKREGFQQLIRNGFGELGIAKIWFEQFNFYSRIADQAQMFRLEIPDDLDRVSEFAEKLVETFSSIRGKGGFQ